MNPGQTPLSQAFFYSQPQPGYLRLSGPDRENFLQRQSTNDIRPLAPDRSVTTVLTTPAGRILDVLTLLAEDDAIGVLTLPGRGAQTLTYLKRHIFFMDQVQVEHTEPAYAQVDLWGEAAPLALAHSRLPVPAEAGQVVSGALAQASSETRPAVRIMQPHPAAGIGYRLLLPADLAAALAESWQALGLRALSPLEYEALRVEAGLPAPDHELDEKYTPLEAGLDAFISDSKGCYTGQEVIARQVNYDKVTRRLAGLKLESAAPVGTTVMGEGKPVGEITSTAQSPRFGVIALAILRRPYHTPGSLVTVDDHTAVVAALPFQP